jgi:hypothetical protein
MLYHLNLLETEKAQYFAEEALRVAESKREPQPPRYTIFPAQRLARRRGHEGRLRAS